MTADLYDHSFTVTTQSLEQLAFLLDWFDPFSRNPPCWKQVKRSTPPDLAAYREYMGCQHSDMEDCFICRVCGYCRETCDEDDACDECNAERTGGAA